MCFRNTNQSAMPLVKFLFLSLNWKQSKSIEIMGYEKKKLLRIKAYETKEAC
jgi:hypothetical protein